ncbi:ECF-type sigma factor [bacterium]|nr:ECF-type sigma factor [bacterium]
MANAKGETDSMTSDSVFILVYDELRKLAAKRLVNEPQGISFQATGLVHEAYIRLVSKSGTATWDSKSHFFGSAAEAMRRILIDKARQRASLKRGGDRKKIEFDEVTIDTTTRSLIDLLELDEALSNLEKNDSRRAAVVKLKYFCGLTLPEIATALDVSLSTVDSDWAYAKAWLKVELS